MKNHIRENYCWNISKFGHINDGTFAYSEASKQHVVKPESDKEDSTGDKWVRPVGAEPYPTIPRTGGLLAIVGRDRYGHYWYPACTPMLVREKRRLDWTIQTAKPRLYHVTGRQTYARYSTLLAKNPDRLAWNLVAVSPRLRTSKVQLIVEGQATTRLTIVVFIRSEATILHMLHHYLRLTILLSPSM